MIAALSQVIISGGFDNIQASDIRFLEEASKLGPVTVLLWPDELIQRHSGRAPNFPLAERLYFLNAVRYVARAMPGNPEEKPDELPPALRAPGQVWVDTHATATEFRRAFCAQHGLQYRVFTADALNVYHEPSPMPSPAGRRKVIATGCYDWLHSGHVRFFEEASALGDLYVVVGHDANIRLLKGAGHPMLPENIRQYLVGSIKFVKQALVSSGEGWLDAEPEIQRLKPDIYVVNEDGDKGGKREYCQRLGIEYIVLKRTPAPGLPPRSSTTLRGF
jgi:cytidyltransferase-like protein